MINSGDLVTGARLGCAVLNVSDNDDWRLFLKDNFLNTEEKSYVQG
jgi:hypothetical protein